MSQYNPYDDYDSIDPWDDDTQPRPGAPSHNAVAKGDTAAWEPVPDYDADAPEYDAADYDAGASHAAPGEGKGSTMLLPKTLVRSEFGDPVDDDRFGPVEPTARHDSGGVLRRRKRSRRVHAQEQPPAAPPYDPSYDDPRAARPGRVRRERAPRRRRFRRRLGCLVPLAIVVALVVGVYTVLAGPIDRQLAFSDAEQQTVNGSLSWSVPGMPYYVLALGSDAREGDGASRTDTMVLIRVDLLGGKLTMVSIPRDTLVDIEGYGGSKINAAYAYGAAGGAVRAVQKLTGVGVNHVAVVHFEELVGLIDYLGGVTVNVPVDVYDPTYSGLSLSAGTQTLDGQTALAWARTRYGFENGDYQRQEDQRILITAIINRVLSLSPREIPAALEQMGGLIGTDMRCYNLVPALLRFKLANPTVYSCAVPTRSEYIDGGWYEIADEQAMQDMLRIVNAGGDPSTV